MWEVAAAKKNAEDEGRGEAEKGLPLSVRIGGLRRRAEQLQDT